MKVKNEIPNLGEMIYQGKNYSIYHNGIANKNFPRSEDYILWENVEVIYVGGAVHTINYIIPNGENRILLIVDKFNNQIKFYMSGFFRMNKESKQQFGDIYTFILQNISERQWGQFINKIKNGESVSFKKFEVTKDAFYFHKSFGGYDKKDINYIKGCSIQEGDFYIHYQEPNKKVKAKRVGSIVDIPNIHIAQMFIKAIAKQA